MIIVMKETATEEQIRIAIQQAEKTGLKLQRTKCARYTILGVGGGETPEQANTIAKLPSVHSVQMTSPPRVPAVAKAYFDCFRLTRRERDLIGLLSEGYSNKEIANFWGISEWTVKDHVKSVYQKTGIHQRTALVAHIMRMVARGACVLEGQGIELSAKCNDAASTSGFVPLPTALSPPSGLGATLTFQ